MALDIVKLYISLLSQFFTLSDMAVSSPTSSQTANSMLPMNTHSLSTAHYLTKISGEIQDATNDLKAMEISAEVSQSLRSLLESTRWRFVDVLIQAWQRGLCPN